MQRSDVDVSDVHRNLGDPVFLYEPADCLAALQRAGDHHGLAVSVFHDFAGNRVALPFRTAFLAHVKGHGIGPAGRSRVEVEIHGDQEIARAHI